MTNPFIPSSYVRTFRLPLLTAVLFVCASNGPAHAVCGDVAGDGSITSTDALSVLRAAVGQPVDLTCDTGEPQPVQVQASARG